MSTGGGQTKKPIDLLVALGVNDEVSRKNINTYIKRIKNITDLTINLDIKGHNTQIFIEYEKQIKALEQHLEALNQKLKSVGTGTSPTFSLFNEFKQQVTSSVKFIDQLNEAIGDVNLNVKSFYKRLAKVPDGDLKSLEQLLQQIKTEMETVTNHQFVLNGIQETQQSLQELETSLYNFYTLNSAYANNTNFEQLTYQISELNSQINNIQLGEGLNIAGISDIPSQLEKINQGIVEFGENTKEASQSSTSLLNEAKKALELSSLIKSTSEGITGAPIVGRALRAVNVIGFATVAVELLVNKIMESSEKAKQQALELEAEQKNILNSFTSNASEIDTLSTRYAELEKAMSLGNTDVSVLAEYREISNQIGEILPHIVTGEDEFGNNIIGSAEALKVKIGLLKEQQVIEAQLAGQKAQEDRNEDIKVRKKSISKLEGRQRAIAENLHYKARTPLISDNFNFSDAGKPVLKSAEDYENKMKEFDKLQSKAEKSGNSDLADYYQNLSNAIQHHMEEIIDIDDQLNQHVLGQKSDYISNIAQIIDKNNELTESVKNNAVGFAAQLIAAADASELDNLQESLTSLFSNVNADSVINDIIRSFQNMENATSDTFDSMASQAKNKLSSVSNELSKLGLNEDEITSIMKSLNKRFEDTTKTQKELSLEMKVHSLTYAEAKAKVLDYKDEVEKLTTTYEKLAGVSQTKVNETSDLLFQYEMLTNQLKGYTEEEIRNLSQKGNLTAEEQRLVDTLHARDLIMSSLNTLYPFLLDQDGKAIRLSEEKIKAIQAENLANETLLYAYKLSREGKLSSEQQKTLDSAQEVKNRIKLIEDEIQALILLDTAQNVKMTDKEFHDGIENGSIKPNRHSFFLPREAEIKAEVSIKTAELNKLREQLYSLTNNLYNSITTTQNSTKPSNTFNKTVKDSIYIINKYKKSLENLNLEIEKQVKIQSSLPKHSEAYRKSLQEQLKLEKEKLTTMENQAKSLQSQISTRKIQKTGTISNSATTTTTQKLSGWSGKISSNYGKRILNGKSDDHRGIDIAMPRGTRLDANISGKVIASGKAGEGNDYHSSYGNIVVIQDANNLKHIYAHLEQSIAKIGTTIEAGQQIGTIGSTGTSTGPHLHYEINKNANTPINPIDYLNKAKSGTVSSSAIDTTQQAIDQATSELMGLQGDILKQKELIATTEKDIIDSHLLDYEFRKSNYDKFLENSENRLKKLDNTSKEYRTELDAQAKALNAKKIENVAEMKYLEGMIKNGGLSAITIEEYTKKLHELGKVNSEIDFALLEVDTNKLESYVNLVENVSKGYDDQRKSKDAELEYQALVLGELDTASLKYLQSLEKMNKTMREKQTINRQELSNLQNLINSGQLYGEALTNAKDRVIELTKNIKQLQLDIQEKDFEILINIKTQSDAVIDDIQFEIDRADAIRNMYDDGSADYVKYTELILKQYEKMAKKHLETRDALVEELKQRDITAERIKEIKELLEDEHLAYLNATLSIKDYTKQVEEANKSQLEQIANDVISAYKDYIQERKDEHLKLIDEEITRENEKHEKIMKNLQDEMDLFKKNIDERLRLIDREEATRGYTMDIDDMEKERNEIQRQINVLSLDDSHEAKSKRKKLQDQLDEIDKTIAERRHDRDIELQKQGLSDLLELKEEEINGKIEIQDKEHETILNQINREKEYWEKHYTDLLNDERKFAELREAILSRNFENIEALFQTYIQQMKDTMPGLVDTMDGTMNAVGTSIRLNVIDRLQQALNLINEFKSTQIESNKFGDDGFNSNAGSNAGSNQNTGNGTETSKGNLSEGDLQVLFGKFFTDKVAYVLTGSEKEQAHSKGNSLGIQGRDNHSTLDKNTSFDSYVSSLTIAEMRQLEAYFNQHKGTSGGKYTSFIEEYLKNGTLSSGSTSNSTNNAARYNIKDTLSRGDMQVLVAKYMNDVLIHQTSNDSTKKAIKSTADKTAQTGRANNSEIPINAGFKEILAVLNNSQRSQLKNFMFTYTGFISDINLKGNMEQYIAKLDSGGYMNWTGGGIDGKGGKAIIAHPQEIMLNKADTNGLFNSINVMDRIMNTISPLLKALPSASSILSSISNNGDVYEISFTGDIYNTTSSDAKQFAREIMNDIRTRKG